MGRAKQAMMENEMEEAYNNELIDFLEQLIAREELKEVALGIAKQVIDRGAKSMSQKQQDVIDNVLKSYKKNHECDCCGHDNISNLSDYIYIAENGICPTCEYDTRKFMDE